MNKLHKHIFILSLTCFVFSQNLSSVMGNIKSEKDLYPLEGANITLEKENGEMIGTSSDKEGKFIFKSINSGNYQLSISFIGYQTFTENLNLESKQNYSLDVILSIESVLMTKLEITSTIDADFQKIPGAASVINEKSLKLINPIGTQEILEHVPGINAFSDDGIGNSRISIGIRGLNPRRSSRILILEDGIPIQPALYVYPNMYYNPPVERISRVEVIKGSGAVAYGPQTMGGVINYLTKRPDGDDNAILQVTTGENGYNSIFFETGNLIKSNFNPELQVLYKMGDGFRNNNDFDQINTTLKFNFITSDKKTLYSKTNYNFEKSNATYTGLTKWTFENFPNFNPKRYDEFTIKRFSSDLILSEKLSSSILKTSKAFISYFDRRWWRENDIFVSASRYETWLTQNDLTNTIKNLEDYIYNENPTEKSWNSYDDLIRIGNGEDNFGILRTFYVLGLEQRYDIDHSFLNYQTNTEIGGRIYFERFIDDRVHGNSPDSRKGVFYEYDEDQDMYFVDYNQKSQHYESVAISSHISQNIKIAKDLLIKPGVRLELFEQIRVDRLNGSTYQDRTSIELLPGIGFNKKINNIKLFGGIHRGFTPPSSGALNILNFGDTNDGLDVESEKSWNKELGFRYNTSKLDLEVTYFNIDIENMVAAGRSMKFNNLGKVVSKGVELGSVFKLSNYNQFLPDLFFTYTNLNAEVKEAIVNTPETVYSTASEPASVKDSLINLSGKKLPYTPEHTMILGIENNLFNKLSFRFDYKYVSKVFSDFLNLEDEYFGNDVNDLYYVAPEQVCGNIGICGPIDSYSIFNLSINYDITPKMKLKLSAKNLTDEIYMGSKLHSSPYQTDANISSGIIVGPRRQINLSMKYLF